jgi:hypothetical protein
MILTIFGCLFVGKIVNKVLACFYEITSENPSSNPLQEACTCFLKAACDSENCFESLLWHVQYTGENQAITAKESRLLDQSLTMISVFKEDSRNFLIFFSFRRQPKNLQTLCAWKESNDLIFNCPTKIHLVTHLLFNESFLLL